jgi:hypothetical protein
MDFTTTIQTGMIRMGMSAFALKVQKERIAVLT